MGTILQQGLCETERGITASRSQGWEWGQQSQPGSSGTLVEESLPPVRQLRGEVKPDCTGWHGTAVSPFTLSRWAPCSALGPATATRLCDACAPHFLFWWGMEGRDGQLCLPLCWTQQESEQMTTFSQVVTHLWVVINRVGQN